MTKIYGKRNLREEIYERSLSNLYRIGGRLDISTFSHKIYSGNALFLGYTRVSVSFNKQKHRENKFPGNLTELERRCLTIKFIDTNCEGCILFCAYIKNTVRLKKKKRSVLDTCLAFEDSGK